MTPINTVSRTQQVVDQLTHSIVSGELEMAAVLMPERELAQQMGVSRTVVREATKILQSRGLLTIKQGVGTVITGVTSQPMQQVLSHTLHHSSAAGSAEKLTEIRIVLECEVVRLASVRATPEHIARLHSTLDQAGQSFDNIEEFMALDDQFHQNLAESTGNELFVVTLDSFRNLVRQSRALSLTLERPEGPHKEHRAILRAVSQGRGTEAARLMRHHVAIAEELKGKFTAVGK